MILARPDGSCVADGQSGPPRTQSALLEAMQESQVTAAAHPAPSSPFRYRTRSVDGRHFPCRKRRSTAFCESQLTLSSAEEIHPERFGSRSARGAGTRQEEICGEERVTCGWKPVRGYVVRIAGPRENSDVQLGANRVRWPCTRLPSAAPQGRDFAGRCRLGRRCSAPYHRRRRCARSSAQLIEDIVASVPVPVEA